MMYKIIIQSSNSWLEKTFEANNDQEAIRELKRLSWTSFGRAYFLEREGHPIITIVR